MVKRRIKIKKEVLVKMLIIHVVSEKERLKNILERLGAIEARSTKEAKGIERRGGLAFVNEMWSEYEVKYISPRTGHSCRASKVWFKLREEAVEEAIIIDDSFRTDGSFWARMEKEDFLAVALKMIDKYEPRGDCSCEKAAKMEEIRELLESVEGLQQEEIDGCYTDLEGLLGLNPEMSKPSTVLVGKEK